MRIKKMKKRLIYLQIFLLLFTSLIPDIFAADSAALPSGPTQTQTVSRDVTGSSIALGGVYWYQLDNGQFRAETDSGIIDVDNVGTEQNPYPTDKTVDATIHGMSWKPKELFDSSSNKFLPSQVDLLKVTGMSYDYSLGNTYLGIGSIALNGNNGLIHVKTGISYDTFQHSEFMKRPNGSPKYIASYYTPISVNWTAKVYETKKIAVTGLSPLKTNDSQQFKTQVDTKNFGSTSYTIFTDVSAFSQTTWASSNTTVATVSATGVVTGKSIGTTTIKATWSNGTYLLTDSKTITVTEDATPTPTPTPTTTPIGQTPGPTEASTPSPTPEPPTCETPPTVSLIAPGTAKQGEDFYVSGFGSKQANGGTNLSYQWYYYPTPNGSVTVGPSVQSPTLKILSQGSYNLILGVTDLSNPICTASLTKSITITAPGPDADVTITGTLKIKRPMVLDGSSSSSPSAYPIVDSSRIFSITYPSGVTASDCVILDALTGTKKARIMCRKPGTYSVKYSVTNTLGLSGTKSKTFTVEDDLKPVGHLQGPSVVYRDPIIGNKANIPLTFTFTSPDNDTIATTVVGAIADANNDGFFVDDINNTLPVVSNLIMGTASVTAASVGHIRNILSGCETFDAGDFASYLTSSDYLCSAGYLDVTVDNQAPTMSIGASKRYKADIYVNIGSVPTADQTYLLNNIQILKANLGAQQVDAKVIATNWDTNVEMDFLKDSNSKLNTNTWRNPIDKKYFVGYTNALSQGNASGTVLNPLDLKAIQAYNTPLNGTIDYAKLPPLGGNTAYIVYKTPNVGGNYQQNLFIASNGTGSDAATIGRTSSTSASSSGSLDFDTLGRYYTWTMYEVSTAGDAYRHNYSLSGTFGNTGTFTGFSGYNQLLAKPSLINNQWTVWSSAGIYFMTTWNQIETYYRKAANSWNPTTAPDYCQCNTNTPDAYTEGYQIGANVYWFAYGGSLSGQGFKTYLGLHYNGGNTTYQNYGSTIYGREILVNGISIVVQKLADNKFYKLTFTNGVLTSEFPYTNLDTNAQNLKFNFSANKAYFIKDTNIDGQTRYQATIYNLATNTVISSKVANIGIKLLDIGWDADGVTPIYLFKTDLSEMVYISKDGDTAAASTDVMQKVSTATDTVSYNTNGTYSWVEYDRSFYNNSLNTIPVVYTTKGTVYKIRKVDSLGKTTYKAFSGADGTTLFGNMTYSDDSVVAFGVNAITGVAFYALESEDYIPHNLNNIHLGQQPNVLPTYTNANKIYKDNLGNVFIKTSSNQLYKFDLLTGTAALVNGSVPSNEYENIIYNGKAYTLQKTTYVNGGSTLYSWVMGESVAIKTNIPTTTYVSTASSSIDFDSSGYIAGTVTLYDDVSKKYNTYFNTNRPDFWAAVSNTDLSRIKINEAYDQYQVRIKFTNNNLYLYVKKANNTEVYQMTQQNLGTSGNPDYYLKLTLTGYIQNTNVTVSGFTGNSNYVYGNDYANGYTNDPKAKALPDPTAFTVSANFNGLDKNLFQRKYANDSLQYMQFDNKTNSFARAEQSYSPDGLTRYLDGIFYNPSTNTYNKVRHSIAQTSSTTFSNFNYSPAIFSNSLFLYTLTDIVSSKNYSQSVWKMNRNGTSLVYTVKDPNYTDNTMSLQDVKARQDDQGYTYILYSVAKSGSAYNSTFIYYLATNKSGAFVTTQLNLNPAFANSYNFSDPFIHNGNLTFYLGDGGSGTGSGNFYNIPTSHITANPTMIDLPDSTPNKMRYIDITYDNGQVYALGQYNKSGSLYENAFISTVLPSVVINNTQAYYIDDYSVYLTTGATDGTITQLYQYNKVTMALQNSSPKGIGVGYPMTARGKVMTFNLSGTTGSAKVINAIELDQGNPDFINTLGGKGIVPIFIGNNSSIADDVNPIIRDNKGYLIDYTMSVADSLTALTTTIVDDLKNANGPGGGNIYFLKDDTVNMIGMYADYENDPEQTSQRIWNLTHDPSMFDNNQGTIATSGQELGTTITVFDHVGKYTAKVKAKDDPSYGYAALLPYAKFSTPTPLVFYVHRKPFAHFSYFLKDNPSNPAQALFSYVEDSYDLDHSITLAATTKGIVKKTWRWKLSSELTWKNGLPPSILSKNSSYVLSLTVTDLEGADSDPYTVTFDTGVVTPNILPTAVIVDPTGTTAASPTIYAAQKPIYKWVYADADGDSQQKYWLYVYDSNNNLVAQSNEVISSALAFQQPSDLIEEAIYSVQVKVHDGFGYSSLSAKKFFKIVTNRPPNGNISFLTPIYQNDTPLFTITQSDPDGDDLTIKIESSFKGGSYTTVKQWDAVASGSSKTFTLGPLAQGVYSLRLTLDDGKGGIYTQIYSLTALPLFLNGAIKHTAIWESNRLQWNIKFPAKSRAADVFWAGEALELFATATDTGSGITKPQAVSATLLQTGDSVSLSSSDHIHYSGEMANVDFIHSLVDGLYTMQFQIRWSNGMIQKTDVPFYIQGNMLDVIVVQLRN